MSNLAPEPLSLCTLPLNEGNCTADPSKPASPGAGSLAAALARKRFYFNKEESKCMEFTHQVSPTSVTRQRYRQNFQDFQQNFISRDVVEIQTTLNLKCTAQQHV